MRGEALVKKRCCHVKALPREHRKMLNDKMMMRATSMYNFWKKTYKSLKSKIPVLHDYWMQIYEEMLENEVCQVREFILVQNLQQSSEKKGIKYDCE